MTREQKRLIAQVRKANARWQNAPGEEKLEAKVAYEALVGRSDVREAIGAATQERIDAGRLPR